MARPKPTFTPDPRILNQYQVACRLNKSEQWFMSNRKALEQMGFPRKDALLAGWDGNSIEAWLDKRSGVCDASDIEQQMLEAIRGQDLVSIRPARRGQRTHILSVQAERPADSTAA